MASIGPELPPHLLSRQSPSQNDSKDDDDATVAIGPQIPSLLPQPAHRHNDEDEDEDEDDYAPALPPDLAAARTSTSGSSSLPPRRTLGPTLPSSQNHDRRRWEGDDDDDDDVGPKPLPAGYAVPEKDGVAEFIEKEEKRRKQVEEAAKPKALKRDEWMLVPPTSSDLLGSLDPTKLKARQFSRGTAPVRDTDSSLWTETPAERQQRLADEVSGRKRRAANADPTTTDEAELEARKRRRRDEEIRKGVEEHTRRTRGETLVDLHAHGEKDDEKTEPDAIWDHSRDMSLGGRLMDEKTRNKMLKDARSLGDRFGSGTSGGFL